MCRTKNLFFLISLTIFSTLSTQTLASGGVSLSTTRIIYNASANEEHININNSSTDNAFLIQSWLTDENGNKTKDFIVTPPLFVLKPGKEGTLRISRIPIRQLPGDRESLFYLNSKAIPSVDVQKGQSNNLLLIATQSRIKMFVRPNELAVKPTEATSLITCRAAPNTGFVDIRNDSPYYVTMTNVTIGKKNIGTVMVPPLELVHTKHVATTAPLTFQTINDYGGMTRRQTCKG